MGSHSRLYNETTKKYFGRDHLMPKVSIFNYFIVIFVFKKFIFCRVRSTLKMTATSLS